MQSGRPRSIHQRSLRLLAQRLALSFAQRASLAHFTRQRYVRPACVSYAPARTIETIQHTPVALFAAPIHVPTPAKAHSCEGNKLGGTGNSHHTRHLDSSTRFKKILWYSGLPPWAQCNPQHAGLKPLLGKLLQLPLGTKLRSSHGDLEDVTEAPPPVSLGRRSHLQLF